MGRLVANLLDMIRVESGTLQVQKEWQLLPDVVGVALLRTEEQLRDHPVTTSFPADLPLVPIDEILLEQVFVNLLENAARHTPPGTPIEVGAEGRPARGDRLRRRSGARAAGGRGGASVPEVLSRRGAEAGAIGLGPHHLPRHRHRARGRHLGENAGRAAAPSSGSRFPSPARHRSW